MVTPMDLNKLKEEMAAKEETSEEVAPVEASPQLQVTAEDEQSYQHYSSSRIAMRMITPTGKRITFTNFTFITADDEVIAYIDSEIAQGLREVKKGKRMTHAEADPMQALKRQIIKEYEADKAKQAAKPAEEKKDLGSSEQGRINALSTEGVAN